MARAKQKNNPEEKSNEITIEPEKCTHPDWAFNYPEENCVVVDDGKTYWLDNDQI